MMFLPSPPLAPDAAPSSSPTPFDPNSEQTRFLLLHTNHIVVKWVWLMQETQLRAYSERGFTATISRVAVDELVRAGAMEWGFGCADCKVTDAGRDVARGWSLSGVR